VELFTQSAYMVFQVVQVFLVTTLTSAASAAFTDVLKDPLSAKDLLSANLPKSSNFYLSYILVQCLAGGSWGLMHLSDLFRYYVLARTMQYPRKTAVNWYKMRTIHWGGIYPVFTNMAVIGACHGSYTLRFDKTKSALAISYSCIAPLILLFAALGMLFVRISYKYNLLYSWDSDLDTQGLVYPRALLHLMYGLYMAEICLIGLFGLQSAVGPVLLMALFLIFTGLVHVSLMDAVDPLLYSLPRTLALGDKDLVEGDENDAQAAEQNGPVTPHPQGAAAEYYAMEEGEAFSDNELDEPDEPDELPLDANTINRGVGDIEGGRSFLSMLSTTAKQYFKRNSTSDPDEDGVPASRFLARLKAWGTPDPKKEPNFVTRWLHPEIYEDYRYLQRTVVKELAAPVLAPAYARRGYQPPEMWSPAPKLWIPRDEGRVSRQEVAHTRAAGVQITDHGAWLDDSGWVRANMDECPFIEPRIVY
jgi:calcium permeable stress-gated cation channel